MDYAVDQDNVPEASAAYLRYAGRQLPIVRWSRHAANTLLDVAWTVLSESSLPALPPITQPVVAAPGLRRSRDLKTGFAQIPAPRHEQASETDSSTRSTNAASPPPCTIWLCYGALPCSVRADFPAPSASSSAYACKRHTGADTRAGEPGLSRSRARRGEL